MTPYQAMFGCQPRVGVENECSSDVVQKIFAEHTIETEEELLSILYPDSSSQVCEPIKNGMWTGYLNGRIRRKNRRCVKSRSSTCPFASLTPRRRQ